jgi:putative endonuclease
LNKRKKGSLAEDRACEHIGLLGGTVICRNYYFHTGEIDIIALDRYLGETYLCFIEVKYRKDASLGFPEEAVTRSKQQKILQGAKVFMNHKRIEPSVPVRFDVVSILGDDIKWIKNAFS